jgi:hypothetical protein
MPNAKHEPLDGLLRKTLDLATNNVHYQSRMTRITALNGCADPDIGHASGYWSREHGVLAREVIVMLATDAAGAPEMPARRG